MCLIRFRPSSPPPSPTVPARFIPPPTPRLSIHAPTPRLSIQTATPPAELQLRQPNLRRSSSRKRQRYSSSSPLPSANDITRKEGIETPTPKASFVRERPKGEEGAAVKAVNFRSPPPPTITDTTTSATQVSAPRSSQHSISSPITPTSRPSLAPKSASSISNSQNRIPPVRRGSEYSYGAGPVRSSATSFDQHTQTHHRRVNSSSTNVKCIGPTTSVEVVVAQRGEEQKKYTIVRRISHSQNKDTSNAQVWTGEGRHGRTLSSSSRDVNTHWGDPRRSGASIHSQKTRDKEPFGEEVPMRRLASNPLPHTAPMQGALNFNPPPPTLEGNSASDASTAPLLGPSNSTIITTIMPPPQHKRTYSKTSVHRSNSIATGRPQRLSQGPRGSQGSVNNWGENPRSSVRSTRERIVVVDSDGQKREYWRREEG